MEKFPKLTITRSKEHEFLGIHIKYLDNGTAEITMPFHISSAIEGSGLTLVKKQPTMLYLSSE